MVNETVADPQPFCCVRKSGSRRPVPICDLQPPGCHRRVPEKAISAGMITRIRLRPPGCSFGKPEATISFPSLLGPAQSGEATGPSSHSWRRGSGPAGSLHPPCLCVRIRSCIYSIRAPSCDPVGQDLGPARRGCQSRHRPLPKAGAPRGVYGSSLAPRPRTPGGR